MQKIRKKIVEKAKEIGFDLVGFSTSQLDEKYTKAYKKWLDNGMNADMGYMKTSAPRLDISEIIPDAKTVIVLALNYYHVQEPLTPTFKRVSKYAYGRDYHKIIPKMLRELEQYIVELIPDVGFRSFTDTGPVLERAYAEQSGIGYVGKNSLLITPEFGSFVFLAEVIIDADLIDESYVRPDVKISCGQCRQCLDKCPTNAIVEPRVIDANRCISYLTIEKKGEINEELSEIIRENNIIFGCDICQDVCPHNCRAKEHIHDSLRLPKIAGNQISADEVLEMESNDDFIKRFAGSPIVRAKFEGMRRNSNLNKNK